MLCLGKASLLTSCARLLSWTTEEVLAISCNQKPGGTKSARVVVNRGCSSPCSTSVFKIG